MGIAGIPATWQTRRSKRGAAITSAGSSGSTDSNHRIAVSTRDLFASWFPRIATPIVRYSIYAMLDEAMIASFGFPKPLPLTRPLLRSLLQLRGRAVRWLPPRKTAHFFTDNRNRTHPDGYEISGLGPPKLVAAAEKRAKSEV